MEAIRQAILGKGNRATSILGIAAIFVALGNFLLTGELDTTSLGVGFSGLIGLFARGGGTGSDKPE